jgi:outer membrane protein TolC
LILQLGLQETMLNKNILIEKANYFPTLSLFGGYQWQAQDNTYRFGNYNWAKMLNVGLALSYPLFDGFRTRERVQQATIDRDKVHYTKLKIEEGLKIQIQSAELKMAEAEKRISGQGKNIEQAQKAVRIAQTRFKSGVGTQLELLDAQVAMTRAQTNYAQAIYDYLIAKADWQYAVGQAK